jgi:hypothetical protein
VSHAVIATAADRSPIAARRDESRIVAVVLCAAWCDTCSEFRGAPEAVRALPEALRTKSAAGG